MHETFADRPTQDQRTRPEAVRDTGPLIGQAIGPYTIKSVLGEGGFGVVCLAEQTEPLRREVALKLLKYELAGPDVVARFEAERQALALLDHPGVAKVLDAGVVQDHVAGPNAAAGQGRPYFVMEYVPGVPIHVACDQRRLSTGERLRLMIQVCEAVQHAHQKGIIHRDLKPSNILVSEVNGRPTAKVIDFGIAKAVSGGRLTARTLATAAGQVIGTPEYMSPEQAGGNPADIDTRADIYALGVVLYELLTGTLPLESATLWSAGAWDVPRVIRTLEPPAPSQRVRDLARAATRGEDTGPRRLETTLAAAPTEREVGAAESAGPRPAAAVVAHLRGRDTRGLERDLRGDLDWIVMKCLEKDRARRYDSAAALAADLQRHLNFEPVLAGPPSAAYRVRKFVRRHRGAVAVGAAAVALLLGTAVAMAGMYAQAERQRARAEQEAGRANAALQFLKDMFATIDPAQARGREVTVREVVEDAGHRLDAATTDPWVEQSVRALFGTVNHQLGRYEEAQAMLRRSLELARVTWGPDDRETLTVWHNLGAALASAGAWGDARKEWEQVAAARARAFGPHDADTLATLSLLALAQQRQGDLAGAEVSIRGVIAAQTETRGADHAETLDSRLSLADILEYQGKLDEAEREAADISERAEGALGADAPIALTARSIRGSILMKLARYQEAERELRLVMEQRTRIFGPEHPETLTASNVYARVLKQLNRLDEAEPLQRRLYEVAKAKLGATHDATISYANNLASVLEAQQKFAEAEELYRATIDACLRSQGDSAGMATSARNNYGVMLTGLGRYQEALPLLEAARSHLEATLPADHWMLAASRTFVAECLIGLKRFDEAEPLLTESRRVLEQKFGAAHDRTRRNAGVWAKLCEARGDAAQAAEWRAKADAH